MDNSLIITKYLNGDSLEKIHRQYNIPSIKIRKILVNNGITIRNMSQSQQKYPIDENMFKVIDNEYKAYLLGWLFSDGNVYTGAGRYTISLALAEKDKEILNKLNNFVFNGLKPLEFRPAKISKFPNGSFLQCQAVYRMQIDNKSLTHQLIDLGCVPAKSLILQFPTSNIVPDSLMPHFLRGEFDGDGSISISKKGPDLMFHGSLPFCLGLETFLSKLNIYGKVSKIGGCYRWRIHRMSEISKLFDYLYSNSSIKLDRKFQKMKIIKDKHITLLIR